MTTHTSTLLRSLALLLVSLGLLASVPAAQGRDSEFMKEFRMAMKIHDRDEMASLVKKNEVVAVMAVIETCEMISDASNEQLEEEIDALIKAWRKAFDTRFVVIQYEYFSLLRGENKRYRKELLDRYLVLHGEFVKARETQDKGKLPQVGLDFEGMSQAFEELGDYYMASLTAWHFAECFDRKYNPKNGDLRRACRGYGRTLEMRDKIELFGSTYDSLKVAFESLEFEGYGDPEKGPEARDAARAAEDSSFAPRALEAKFELIEDIDEVARPLYFADASYQLWQEVHLAGNESSGGFPALEGGGPKVIREAAAKAKVDVDGDGAGDVEVPVTGKMTAVQITLDGRDWGFLATVGQEKDTYQGVQPFNLGPNDDQMVVYVAPAASIVGMIGETRIQVIDDNMDGRYGSDPKAWNSLGLRQGDVQNDIDSIVVGESERALPWSSLVKVGEDWYRFEPTEDGTDVIVAKTEIETGILQLDCKGVDADYVILRGTGNNDDIFVDVAANKKGVEVPVGSYGLFGGRVGKGRGAGRMKAMIVPATNTPSWSAVAGETTKVELGAPFGFDFRIEQTDETVTVKGQSIVVTGRGRETYQRLWNCVPKPEASERKVGSKRGSKGEKMAPIENQEEMIPVGWWSLWFPLDVELEKKKKGEDVEVQLVEKKNKLFGKIESEWKG